ncbi:MAG: hypothetical protein HN725_16905 [Alphaproteobacteria bacterium]|jgi:hypothetical protein|nr:hypothetical protein [Alphaproteobacteria bacterium]MBT4085857.1 hypothetical protein [Alphaproteobacteria bacterium]MBT4542670.1 hypothetical protein [Alphaproteobacteria bacterium]MBT7746972.1 hypothetical protein [Alphaproteobacteria bacterium]
MSSQDLFSACETEVNDLHNFFVDWMGAKVERDEKTFRQFTDTLSGNFTLVSPDGTIMEQDALVPGLEASYGSRPVFKIWIKDCKCRSVSDDQCLITYEEWQDIGGVGSSRISTALFARRADTPNGVEWLHVHETWLPGNEPK